VKFILVFKQIAALLTDLKGRLQCFSMQVVMSKCFLLNPENKFGTDRLVVFKKNAHSNSEK